MKTIEKLIVKVHGNQKLFDMVQDLFFELGFQWGQSKQQKISCRPGEAYIQARKDDWALLRSLSSADKYIDDPKFLVLDPSTIGIDNPNEVAKDMLRSILHGLVNQWGDAPILIEGNQVIFGSHRLTLGCTTIDYGTCDMIYNRIKKHRKDG
jgi:hypothetical protein